MPYITQNHRTLEFYQNDNILVQASEFLKEASTNMKGNETRDFCAYLIDSVYGEPCFSHSNTMAANVSPQLVTFANYLSVNICRIHDKDGGREGLLNYTFTRLFNETYPSARYKDYNQIAGILTSLISMCHPGSIDLLGMLSCCKDEYYRKYTAPYEDIKEKDNEPVIRPNTPPPISY